VINACEKKNQIQFTTSTIQPLPWLVIDYWVTPRIYILLQKVNIKETLAELLGYGSRRPAPRLNTLCCIGEKSEKS
jgi:hypothetical protein